MLLRRTSLTALSGMLLLALLLLSACGTAVLPTPTALPAGPAPSATPLPTTPGIALEAQPAFDGYYQSGSWLPVTVTVQNDGADRQALVQVGDGQAAYGTHLDLPQGARKSTTLYIYLSGRSRSLDVWLTAGNTRLAQQRLQLTPHTARSHLIAVVGAPALPRLPDQLANGAEPVVVPVDMAELPTHSFGLSSFSTLLLADADTRLLNADQQQALNDWVALGGQLLIVGGPGAAATLAGLHADLQPVRITGNQQVAAAELLGIDATQLLSVSDFAPSDDAAVRPRPNRALAADMVVERPVGRGLVVFVAPALGSAAFVSLVDAPLLWADLLELRQLLPLNFGPGEADLDAFIESNLTPVLTSMPALEFPSLLLVALLVALYILLVGPLTYLLLRRVDRLALGWLLIPALTLIFAVAGYLISYQQRGGDVVFNQVALIEQFDHSDAMRLRSFLGMFSPAQQAYSLTVEAQPPATSSPLLRPMSLQGLWGPAPAIGTALFLQPDSAAAPLQVRDLPVAQWSMQAMMLEQLQPGVVVDAGVLIAVDGMQAEVHNRGNTLLHDVVVVQGDQVARFGDLAPGERHQLALTRNDAVLAGPGFAGNVPLSYLIYGEELDQAGRHGSYRLDPHIQQRVRMLDALSGYGPVVRDARPLLLAWTDVAPFRAEVSGERAENRSLTLITMHPRLSADGPILLDRGWLRTRYDAQPASLCVGGQGLGATPDGHTTQVRMRLPDPLRALRIEGLTLLTSADGTWPSEATLRLYDWQARRWVPVEADAARIAVAEPARFVSVGGTLLAEFESPPAGMMHAGCLYLDAEIEGRMP